MPAHFILSIALPLLTPAIFYLFGYESYTRSIYSYILGLSIRSLITFVQIIPPWIPWLWILFSVVFLGWVGDLCVWILWIGLAAFWGCAFVYTTVGIQEGAKQDGEEGATRLILVGVEKTIKIVGENEVMRVVEE